MIAGLIETGAAPHLHFYLLSDTDQPAHAAIRAEHGSAAGAPGSARSCRSHIGAGRPNTGFKAGNIRDFCQRWGAASISR